MDKEKMMIQYDGQFVPKEMCSINRIGEADDCDACRDICDDFIEHDCEKCPIQKAFARLAAYEAAGLTPEHQNS